MTVFVIPFACTNFDFLGGVSMQIAIGENLKRLRKSRNMTQEDLATTLGVSFQAVSKWERGDTYPDIAMLPALANFFGVTTDELIGMEDLNKRETMWNIHKNVSDLQKAGQYGEATALLRDKLKLYPGDSGLISALAVTQVMAQSGGPQTAAIYNEAIEHFESYLDIGKNEKFYSYVRAVLVFLYDGVGERDKAHELALTLPHIWESREILAIEMLEGEAYTAALKRTMALVLSILADKVDDMGMPQDKQAAKYIQRLVLGFPSEGDVCEKLGKIAKFLGC
jgi:transcriptional regulator with XRE-family HTH domain